MNMYDIITKKKHGETLSTEEIQYLAGHYGRNHSTIKFRLSHGHLSEADGYEKRLN
jgi:hypothetical protein